MHSGKREARVVRIPFCTESSSEGRPSDAHCPVSTSLVSSVSSLKGTVMGTPRLAMSSHHSW